MRISYARAMSQQRIHTDPLITLTDIDSVSTVVIAPARGALVTSFQVDGRELLYFDAATFADTTKNVRGGIPVLFPSPGKLAGDAWRYDGREGAMKQHGFARNLPWMVLRRAASSLSLMLESDASTIAQFPWHFRATLEFTLTAARLRIAMKVENRADSTMPFGLGYHPYFQVADKPRARIDTGATQAFDNVTQEVVPFSGFDLTQPEVDLHLLDHGSAMSALHFGDSGSIEVSASSDFSRWVVWTQAGKDFVCLEPWTSPGNAINTHQGLIELAAGRVHESWIEVSFSSAVASR